MRKEAYFTSKFYSWGNKVKLGEVQQSQPLDVVIALNTNDLPSGIGHVSYENARPIEQNVSFIAATSYSLPKMFSENVTPEARRVMLTRLLTRMNPRDAKVLMKAINHAFKFDDDDIAKYAQDRTVILGDFEYKVNGWSETIVKEPEPVVQEEKPKRKRRTKAEIEADRLAAEAKQTKEPTSGEPSQAVPPNEQEDEQQE